MEFLPFNPITTGLCDQLRALARPALTAVDIETGKGTGDADLYGVEPGQEALNPRTGRILLAGVRSPSTTHMLCQADERRLLEDLCSFFNQGGIIVGHNILGFDLPFISARCKLLGVDLPYDLCATRNTRVRDTMREFDPFSLHPKGAISLSDVAHLLGRPFDSHGAHFGDQWKDLSLQPILMVYNAWNLADTLLLDWAFRGGLMSAEQSCIPDPGWEGPVGWLPPADFPPPSPPHSDTPCFRWISAPCHDLLDRGPGSKGWTIHRSPEARLKYCLDEAPLDARCCRAVGWATPKETFLDPDNELGVLASGIARLEAFAQNNQPALVEDPVRFRAFTTYRLLARGARANLPEVQGLPSSSLREEWLAHRFPETQEPRLYQGGSAEPFRAAAAAAINLVDENPGIARNLHCVV